MNKARLLNATDVEALLLRAGFKPLKTKGRHRIYQVMDRRIVIPFLHTQPLHPKIIKGVMHALALLHTFDGKEE